MNRDTLIENARNRLAETGRNVRPLLRSTQERLGAVRERLAETTQTTRAAIARRAEPLTAPIRAKIDAHPHLLAKTRGWAEMLGLHHRPVQLVGAAVIAGFVWLAVADPFAKPAPDDPSEVAARLAPVGSVNLLSDAAPQVADANDFEPLPPARVN
jgi:hypothetical protein